MLTEGKTLTWGEVLLTEDEEQRADWQRRVRTIRRTIRLGGMLAEGWLTKGEDS